LNTRIGLLLNKKQTLMTKQLIFGVFIPAN